MLSLALFQRYGGISAGGMNSQVRLTEEEVQSAFDDLRKLFAPYLVRNYKYKIHLLLLLPFPCKCPGLIFILPLKHAALTWVPSSHKLKYMHVFFTVLFRLQSLNIEWETINWKTLSFVSFAIMFGKHVMERRCGCCDLAGIACFFFFLKKESGREVQRLRKSLNLFLWSVHGNGPE